MVQTSGLAHMTIAVTDTERSLEFYRRHLGMTFLGGSHDYAKTASMCFSRKTAKAAWSMARAPISTTPMEMFWKL